MQQEGSRKPRKRESGNQVKEQVRNSSVLEFMERVSCLCHAFGFYTVIRSECDLMSHCSLCPFTSMHFTMPCWLSDSCRVILCCTCPLISRMPRDSHGHTHKRAQILYKHLCNNDYSSRGCSIEILQLSLVWILILSSTGEYFCLCYIHTCCSV